MYDSDRGTHMEGIAGDCDPSQLYQAPPPNEATSPPDLRVISDTEALNEVSFDSSWGDFDFAHVHEYTQEELRSLFTNKDIADIEAYHYLSGTPTLSEDTDNSSDIDRVIDTLIKKPLPKYGNPDFNLRLEALVNNVGTYEDEVEDAIAMDNIIQKLMAKRSAPVKLQPEYAKQIVQAVRVRRSILAHQYQSDPTQP